MSAIAVFRIPTTDFLLGEFLEGWPEIEAKLEAVVPTEDEPMPYVWLAGATSEIVNSMSADSTVAAATVLDETTDGALIKVRWTEEDSHFMQEVVRSAGTILDGSGRNGEWTLRLRFPDREALAAFTNRCQEYTFDIHLRRLHDSKTTEENPLLTPRQHEALRVALALGYFEIPREATLDQIARELDVSDNAVSQRPRRGIKRVVEVSVAE